MGVLTARKRPDGCRKRVTAISDEMRDVIETEWPDLAAKLLPPKD
jgi:hypothetical protein